MGQVTFSIRMDEDLKKQFEAQCDLFGMSMSSAFNVFARKVVLEKKIPFSITSEAEPATALENLENKIDKLAKETKNIREKFINQIKEQSLLK